MSKSHSSVTQLQLKPQPKLTEVAFRMDTSLSRVSIFFLVALTLAATLTVIPADTASAQTDRTATGPLVPDSGVLWGAYVMPRDNWTDAERRQSFQEHDDLLGRESRIANEFFSFNKPWKMSRLRWHQAEGRIPMVSWNGTYADDILSGAKDELIRLRAQDAKSLGEDFFLRFFWEMDASKGAKWGYHDDPQRYIDVWNYVRAIFTEEGADNAIWVWSPTAWNFSTRSAIDFYPGDAAVDWIAADGYYFGCTGAAARPAASVFGDFLAWANNRAKPLMIAEWGADANSETGAVAFVDSFTDLLTDNPNIAAVVNFDAIDPGGRGCDWRVDATPSVLAAHQALATNPMFDAVMEWERPVDVRVLTADQPTSADAALLEAATAAGFDAAFGQRINATLDGLYIIGSIDPNSQAVAALSTVAVPVITTGANSAELLGLIVAGSQMQGTASGGTSPKLHPISSTLGSTAIELYSEIQRQGWGQPAASALALLTANESTIGFSISTGATLATNLPAPDCRVFVPAAVDQNVALSQAGSRFFGELLQWVGAGCDEATPEVLVVTGAAIPSSTEAAMIAKLSARGWTVSSIDDDVLTNATTSDVILVAASVKSSKLALLAQSTTPVVSGKPWLADDLGLSGSTAGTDFGLTPKTQTVAITAEHFVSESFTGTLSIFEAPQRVGWGNQPAEATVVARSAGRTTLWLLARGSIDAQGAPAASCRAAFPIHKKQALTDEAVDLLSSTLAWTLTPDCV